MSEIFPVRKSLELLSGIHNTVFMGRDSSVGIATGYGLGGPKIESRCEARFSAPVHTVPGNHPASCKMDNGSISQG
jgi:hypothetical protein